MIDILIPCLGRPESIERLLKNVNEASYYQTNIAHFIVSHSDREVLRACVAAGVDPIVATWEPGHADYARKMNLGYRSTEQEWLLMGASDIFFHQRWDYHALFCATRTGARAVGTADLGNPEAARGRRFSTHSLVARSYVDELGTIEDGPGQMLSEVYDHNWVDREFGETAIMRKEWCYCKSSVVEHMHFHWGKGTGDDLTYRKGMRRFQQDRRLYLARRHLWQDARR